LIVLVEVSCINDMGRCSFVSCAICKNNLSLNISICARFVQTIHSLGTPFFNTINHIDALICKTLFPMICCCTEYEAGRLGRFLCETLKMAYHWKVILFVAFFQSLYFFCLISISSVWGREKTMQFGNTRSLLLSLVN
jgi:hypothetical protein